MKALTELMNLSGRRALVTGAAGHIGSMTASCLAEMGAMVALSDRDPAACERQVESLNKSRRDAALSVPCDLTDEKALRNAVRDTIQKCGGLDILVHCAAFVGSNRIPGWRAPFEEQTVEAWDAALRVNLTAAFVLAQEAKDALSKTGKGSVIFFASTYGMVGPDHRLYEGTDMANPAGYGVSKGGLLQLVRHLSTVLAPRVRVNAISPGGVWRDQDEAFHRRYRERTPLGRMATEEDMKGAVAYLASDLSLYMTAQNLVVDGGWTAW